MNLALKKTKFTIILSLVFVFIFSFVVSNFAFAGTDYSKQPALGGLDKTGEAVGYTPAAKGGAKVQMAIIIGNGIKVILSLLGVIFMILVFMGGFDIAGSNGNEEIVNKGKGRIKNGMIGMLAILLAYTITYLGIQWVTEGGALFKSPL